MSHRRGVMTATLTVWLLGSGRGDAAPCADLLRLSVPDTSVTVAESVAAGAFSPQSARGRAP
jgi:hypothetical protein